VNARWWAAAVWWAVALSLLLCAGVVQRRAAELARQRAPLEELLGEAQELDVLEGLRARAAEVAARGAALEARWAAAAQPVASFDEAWLELLHQLRVGVVATTPWARVEAPSTAVGAQLERGWELEGSLRSIQDVLVSLERWPDLIELRGLELSPVAGGVRARVVVRLTRVDGPLPAAPAEEVAE